MNKPIVVSGEASETESEDECAGKKNSMVQSVQGAVITGEDSESENENDASIASAVSALNQNEAVSEIFPEEKYDSLFQQKLREQNERLHNNIQSFLQNTVEENGRNLSVIDQHLLKSQITLQNAVTSLKSLSANSLAVKNKLHSLLSAKFLHNVKTNN